MYSFIPDLSGRLGMEAVLTLYKTRDRFFLY